MKFKEDQSSDETLDLVCRMCPLHLMEPGDRLKCMKKGQVLEVLTDYDGALEDIPEWCRKHGQESNTERHFHLHSLQWFTVIIAVHLMVGKIQTVNLSGIAIRSCV